MGMYDYINGEQVKIFFHPIYDEATQDTWHSGGSMTGYANGDSIPLKTLYYKRQKNFIVLDENEYENNPLLHIIKDGKILTTISLKDADENLFNDNKEVLTYYGRSLGLKTKEDCLNYIKDKQLSADKYKTITKEHTDVFNKKYIPTHWIISHIKPSESTNKFRPDRKSKLNVIFRGISYIEEIKAVLKENFHSYEDLPNVLETNDELWDTFCEIVYPIAVQIHKSSEALLKSISEKNEPLLEKIKKDFDEKYPCKTLYAQEMQLGEYLECLRYMHEDRNDQRLIKDLPSSSERYASLILAIKEFLSNNTSIIQSYIEWLELNELQAKNIIDIFDCIQNDSENIPVNYLDEIINSFNEEY